jgi:3',5'-cyclic AMP phosphodiesterase CpdA
MDAATILHLSDLHLGEDPNDDGRPTRGSLFGWFATKSLEMQSHDPFILSSLHVNLRVAARSCGAGDDFDFYVVTGDISTNATTKERFAFAKQYLTGKLQFGRFMQVGLALDADRVFCVPGNHDKMFEKNLDRYLHGFASLPAEPPYHQSVSARNGRTFHIFGIDSNAYGEGNVAKGAITPATLAWLADQLDQLPDEKPRTSIRLVLLHHHPTDLNKFKRRSIAAWFADKFTTLDEGPRLLALCDGRVDVIMHGHEHLPVAFREENFTPILVSAGTASEWSPRGSQENSFFTLTFSNNRLRVRKFAWNRAAFPFQRHWDFEIESVFG